MPKEEASEFMKSNFIKELEAEKEIPESVS
jgi:hypothetical protein